MSIKKMLRTVFVCAVLEVGALANVPMRPEEIEELMHRLNQPKLAHVLPSERDDDGNSPPDRSAREANMLKMRMLVAATSMWLAVAGVQGDWLVKTVRHDRSGDHIVDLDCEFTEKANSLTGTCRGAGQDGAGTPVAGTVNDSHVEWSFEIALGPDEPKHTARFVGTVDRSGNAMDGSLNIADESGTFTAPRRR